MRPLNQTILYSFLNHFFRLALFASFLLTSTSCGSDEPEPIPEPFDPPVVEEPLDPPTSENPLRILAIGNSFTNNATFYMPQLLSQLYPDNEIFFARVVKGGGSLNNCWNSLSTGARTYEYYTVQGDSWEKYEPNVNIAEALEREEWDIVILQQVSGFSGVAESYQPYLSKIVSEIHSHCPDASIGWQMTWSYSRNSTHTDFARYHNDSQEMYDSIVSALDEVRPYVDFIIPSGTLIQQLRQTEFNTSRDLTEDGIHLASGLPRYALTCLWHEVLIASRTGKSCLGNSLRPKDAVPVKDESANKIFNLITTLLENETASLNEIHI